MHFRLSQFVNAVLNEWPISDVTNKQRTSKFDQTVSTSNQIASFVNWPALVLATDVLWIVNWLLQSTVLLMTAAYMFQDSHTTLSLNNDLTSCVLAALSYLNDVYMKYLN